MRTSTTTTTADASVCERIVEAVAEAQGTSPLDLEPPLYDVVDPDALERFLGDDSRDVRGLARFSYAGCEVTVDDSGTVFVEPRD